MQAALVTVPPPPATTIGRFCGRWMLPPLSPIRKESRWIEHDPSPPGVSPAARGSTTATPGRLINVMFRRAPQRPVVGGRVVRLVQADLGSGGCFVCAPSSSSTRGSSVEGQRAGRTSTWRDRRSGRCARWRLHGRRRSSLLRLDAALDPRTARVLVHFACRPARRAAADPTRRRSTNRGDSGSAGARAGRGVVVSSPNSRSKTSRIGLAGSGVVGVLWPARGDTAVGAHSRRLWPATRAELATQPLSWPIFCAISWSIETPAWMFAPPLRTSVRNGAGGGRRPR